MRCGLDISIVELLCRLGGPSLVMTPNNTGHSALHVLCSRPEGSGRYFALIASCLLKYGGDVNQTYRMQQTLFQTRNRTGQSRRGRSKATTPAAVVSGAQIKYKHGQQNQAPMKSKSTPKPPLLFDMSNLSPAASNRKGTSKSAQAWGVGGSLPVRCLHPALIDTSTNHGAAPLQEGIHISKATSENGGTGHKASVFEPPIYFGLTPAVPAGLSFKCHEETGGENSSSNSPFANGCRTSLKDISFKGATPLHCAIRKGNRLAVRHLLKVGAAQSLHSLDYVDTMHTFRGEGLTSLESALLGNDTEILTEVIASVPMMLDQRPELQQTDFLPKHEHKSRQRQTPEKRERQSPKRHQQKSPQKQQQYKKKQKQAPASLVVDVMSLPWNALLFKDRMASILSRMVERAIQEEVGAVRGKNFPRADGDCGHRRSQSGVRDFLQSLLQGLFSLGGAAKPHLLPPPSTPHPGRPSRHKTDHHLSPFSTSLLSEDGSLLKLRVSLPGMRIRTTGAGVGAFEGAIAAGATAVQRRHAPPVMHVLSIEVQNGDTLPRSVETKNVLLHQRLMRRESSGPGYHEYELMLPGAFVDFDLRAPSLSEGDDAHVVYIHVKLNQAGNAAYAPLWCGEYALEVASTASRGVPIFTETWFAVTPEVPSSKRGVVCGDVCMHMSLTGGTAVREDRMRGVVMWRRTRC
jgi:hypothetical protein